MVLINVHAPIEEKDEEEYEYFYATLAEKGKKTGKATLVKLYEQRENLHKIQNSSKGNKQYPKMRKEEIHPEYN